MKWDRGLTLLELLITVIILGILATFAIPGFGKMVERSRVKDAQTTLNMIFQAERIYRLDQTPPTYGNLADLYPPLGQYLPGNPNNANWNFTVTIPTPPAATFTATATRNSGTWNGNTISLNETFTGTDSDGDGFIYQGTHPLRN